MSGSHAVEMQLPFVPSARGLPFTKASIPLPSSPWAYCPTTSVGGLSFFLPKQQRCSYPLTISIKGSLQDHDLAMCSSDGTPAAAHDSTLGEAMRFLELGCAYNAEGHISAAVEVFRRAVELVPRSAVARAELGRALVRCGLRSEGFESLVASFELDSFCPGVKDGFVEYYRAEIEVIT